MSVRHALLALLAEGAKYGMQLRDEYEAATGDVWPLNVGQVYTTLQRLERDGLVESDGAGDDERQKSFRITAGGQAELRGWLRTPPGPAPPPRDELVTKVLVAVRVPGVDAREVIQAHRRQVVELMQQWTRVKEEPGRVRPVLCPGGRRRADPARGGCPVAGPGRRARAARRRGACAARRPEAAAQGGGPAMSVAWNVTPSLGWAAGGNTGRRPPRQRRRVGAGR